MRAASVSRCRPSSTGTVALHDDRPAVELRGDEVHRHAADLDAVLDRLTLRVEAGERGQQRRVDVQDGVAESVEERRADQAHEAGEADETDVARAQLAHERPIVVVAGRPAVRDRCRVSRCPRAARARGPPRRAIRDHDGDRRSSRPSRMASMSACRLLPRPEMSTPRRRFTQFT